MAGYSIGLVGASGRMGRAVARLISDDYAERAELVACIGSDGAGWAGLGQVDAVIDFSLPAGTGALVDALATMTGELPVVVCGTTGLDDALLRRLESLGERTAVLYATNFAPGVAVLEAVLAHASPMLRALGYTPVMTETHHRHKRDAPSGTAKTLNRAIDPDDPASVQTHSVRAGEIVGRHDVTFFGPDDRIVIGHEALNRDVFARGAIEAALWLAGQKNRRGYRTMKAWFRERFGE